MYKSKKIFDVQDFPDDLKKAIHKYAGECWGAGNDSHISWDVTDWTQKHVDYDDILAVGWMGVEVVKRIDEWLLANGAEVGEDVLLNSWW